ncbi:MAG: RIP metalloprotease RseP [Bacteroidetes bacterium]|nr:RIP metalloprotease RseP [Bacteroidota bacterium]
MEVLTQALQLILSLSILVVLHEMGHFIPARLFKTRVEKFYLFFDPWFSLFKFKKGDTEYGIGWLPLGGYVKISGMIDESMDKEQMKLPPQPWEFRAKPAWQRLIIMVGGVTVNLILGILIYAMVAFVWGEKYLPNANVKYGIACDSLALQAGFRDGDKILSVDNNPVTDFNKITIEILLNKAKTVQVEREGFKMDVEMKEEIFASLIKGKNGFLDVRFPCVIDSVLPESQALKAGLLKGDKMVSINGNSAKYFQDVVKNLRANKNKEVQLVVERNTIFDTLTANVNEAGMLGFSPKPASDYMEFNVRKYGFFEAFPAGLKRGIETIDGYVKQFKVLFTTKDAHQSLGGFISIGKAYDTVWNWQRFWTFTAFLSIVLAFMNILPIPALDGGHVMFLLYEVITGRKPHEKVLEYAQYAGMILLLALLLYANGNDIIRLFTK